MLASHQLRTSFLLPTMGRAKEACDITVSSKIRPHNSDLKVMTASSFFLRHVADWSVHLTSRSLYLWSLTVTLLKTMYAIHSATRHCQNSCSQPGGGHNSFLASQLSQHNVLAVGCHEDIAPAVGHCDDNGCIQEAQHGPPYRAHSRRRSGPNDRAFTLSYSFPCHPCRLHYIRCSLSGSACWYDP
jgi:hypothetical protein